MVIFPESLTKLVTFAKQIDLELQNSSFTLDAGFDSYTYPQCLDKNSAFLRCET